MHRRHASRDHQAARELERAVLFGLVEPPSRSASTVAMLKRVSLILFIAALTLLGGPGADAFASAFFVAGGPTFYVTNNQDSGPGSLRQAILDADATAVKGAPSTITVAAGVALLTIDPQSPLPGITGVVLLDGRGLITVNNTLAGARANGLALQPGSGGSEITGMTIIGAKWAAILLDSPGNLIQGNTIGGTSAASQENRYGVFMVAGNNTIGGAVANTIGGTGASAGNVISGNRLAGVAITGAGTGGNVVEGNFIGTDSAGNNTIGNGVAGVLINAGAANNTIGGIVAGAENVISGNKAAGVAITGADTAGNLVQGNYIGTQAGGTGSLGNGSAGILIDGGATSNTVGGTAPGTGNVIAYNVHAGVRVGGLATAGASILGNSIFANGSTGRGPGIQLTGGANGSEVPPTIKYLTPGTAGFITISGTGKPGSRVEVFEDATCADPEGRQFVATVVPMADGSWRVSAALLPVGRGVTATGTDGSTLDTSPFSRCSLVSSRSTVSSGSPT